MVRLKSRYVLFEVIYPSNKLSSNESLENPILIGHKSSPEIISGKLILQEIRRSLQLHLGDYGYGKVNSLLQLKYFSNNTSTGILRCHREDVDLLLVSLFYINKLSNIENDINFIINPVKISGTIKKIEQYAMIRSNRLLESLKKNNNINNDKFKIFLSNDFQNVNEDNDNIE
ncbi:similar to Saccharomyces cerevisiae YAL033W POP5 Subunit of both RNase MRP and nuclear RNase P [Maudiozyma saulgeensis]|uniref:Ribonuclease P/MRP protein subunit POP5 n=1 Tax=Maudiozyma saulgeensis TaxID=1789683 RepID=A0A1X7R786_9SACH|nr:similar to Saccharomyces cerevisiae YAL033W POP5 Subunit of both RNase MRP and nuclear RNase P [Kazachstania saulgeensis]